jgi:hypothetical protein
VARIAAGDLAEAEPVSVASQKWMAAIKKRAAAGTQYVTKLQQLGVDTSTDALVRHRQCSQALDVALDRALSVTHEAAGYQERFHITLATSQGEPFDLSYTYVAGNVISLSVVSLPRSWSVVLLNASVVATRLNVYTDRATGCAFQFDIGDPSEAIAMAQR